MDIISCSRNTQLLDFPSLTTKYKYLHSGNELEDFSFFSDINVFLSINRKSGFELLRTLCKNEVETIQRMKKRTMEDLSCGTCSTIQPGDIALGTTNGYIQFFNINRGDFNDIKFKPDRPNNSVINLSYSNCNEILAGIYENGDISLYGLKTHIKMDTFKLDKNSTMLRFHPTKRFYLGVVSHIGAFTTMDCQTKKILFQDKTAHRAPCQDFAWSSIAPDTAVTVGFDCKLNVYDIRRKSMLEQINHEHPYSTVSMSACGRYCCAGSLKGDVVAYDFRKLKEPLMKRYVHDGSISRVAFVPKIGERTNENHSIQSVDNTIRNQSTNQSESITKDSFNDLLDYYCTTNTNVDVKPAGKRDSIFDMDFNMGHCSLEESSEELSGPITNIISRKSLDSGAGVKSKRYSKTRTSLQPIDICETVKEEESAMNQSINETKPKDKKVNKRMCMGPNEIMPTVSMKSTANEENINSKPIFKSFLQKSISDDKSISINSPSVNEYTDKENKINIKKESDVFSMFINENSSTPHQVVRPPKIIPIENSSSPFVEQDQCDSTAKHIPEIVDRIEKRLTMIEKGINERLNRLEEDILKNMESKMRYTVRQIETGFKSNLLCVLSNVWAMHEGDVRDIRDGMLALTRQDEFVQAFIQLKNENDELKRQLN